MGEYSIHTLFEKDSQPDESSLRTVFGKLYTAFEEVLSITSTYGHEWKYYGKSHGWQLRITRKGKALLYLIPMDGGFRIGCAVRENEKEALLTCALPGKFKRELENARKVSEGYPIHVIVKRQADMEAVRAIVGVLVSLRA